MVLNVWPLGNIINIIYLNESELETKKIGNKYPWYYELFVRYLRVSTYFIVALLVYHTTFPDEIEIQNINNIKEYLYWLGIILLRDLFLVFIFYQGWTYVLFSSKYASKMTKLRFNGKEPEISQHYHDRYYSLQGSVISSLFEFIVIIFYQKYPYLYQYFNINSILSPIMYVFWLLFVIYWRDFHFYWIHRFMHEWPSFLEFKFIISNKKSGKFNVGKWVYNFSHSLHHKSYNPIPWSGLSMHWFEHILYFTCIWFPLCIFIKQSGLHILFNKYHALLSPLPGHDGFNTPGGGSYFHYLHHSHFTCNYGTPMVPFDKIFGTFSDGSQYKNK